MPLPLYMLRGYAEKPLLRCVLKNYTTNSNYTTHTEKNQVFFKKTTQGQNILYNSLEYIK